MSSKSEFQELVNTFISCGISINEDYLPEPSEFGIGDEHSFQYAFIDAVIASNKDIGYFPAQISAKQFHNKANDETELRIIITDISEKHEAAKTILELLLFE